MRGDAALRQAQRRAGDAHAQTLVSDAQRAGRGHPRSIARRGQYPLYYPASAAPGGISVGWLAGWLLGPFGAAKWNFAARKVSKVFILRSLNLTPPPILEPL